MKDAPMTEPVDRPELDHHCQGPSLPINGSGQPSSNPLSDATPSAVNENGAEDVRDLLLHISREMVGADSLDQMLQTMVDAALHIVPPAEKCVIHLLDPSGTELRAQVCSQPSGVEREVSGIPANSGIAGRALRERVTIQINDTTQAPDFAPLNSGPELRSLLVAPLFVAERPLGTLSLSSPKTAAFRAADQQHVGILAAQASVAINQARLLREAVIERQLGDAIIEGLTDGLILLDGQGRILRLNPAIYSLLELPPDALDLPCDPARDPCPFRMQALLDPAQGTVIGPYEMNIGLPSVARVTLAVTPSSLRDPARGEVRVVHDVTPEREAAKTLVLFVSQVSHELRTPLQHIMSFTNLISDIDDLPAKNRQVFLDHIQDETSYLARLVDDLVQLSRIETGRFSVYPEKTRIDELVANTVSKLSLRAQLRGLTLEMANPDRPIWASTDSVRLGQVLANLLENAFKFVAPGGRIRVSVKHSDGNVIVSVADTGPGIPPEALPHLFDRFYQGNEAQKKRKGMGLGLYISHEIMRALGGDISVESELGVGSVFSLRFPRLPD